MLSRFGLTQQNALHLATVLLGSGALLTLRIGSSIALPDDTLPRCRDSYVVIRFSKLYTRFPSLPMTWRFHSTAFR